jgi:hypothetical protein
MIVVAMCFLRRVGYRLIVNSNFLTQRDTARLWCDLGCSSRTDGSIHHLRALLALTRIDDEVQALGKELLGCCCHIRWITGIRIPSWPDFWRNSWRQGLWRAQRAALGPTAPQLVHAVALFCVC